MFHYSIKIPLKSYSNHDPSESSFIKFAVIFRVKQWYYSIISRTTDKNSRVKLGVVFEIDATGISLYHWGGGTALECINNKSVDVFWKFDLRDTL